MCRLTMSGITCGQVLCPDFNSKNTKREGVPLIVEEK